MNMFLLSGSWLAKILFDIVILKTGWKSYFISNKEPTIMFAPFL